MDQALLVPALTCYSLMRHVLLSLCRPHCLTALLSVFDSWGGSRRPGLPLIGIAALSAASTSEGLFPGLPYELVAALCMHCAQCCPPRGDKYAPGREPDVTAFKNWYLPVLLQIYQEHQASLGNHSAHSTAVFFSVSALPFQRWRIIFSVSRSPDSTLQQTLARLQLRPRFPLPAVPHLLPVYLDQPFTTSLLLCAVAVFTIRPS